MIDGKGRESWRSEGKFKDKSGASQGEKVQDGWSRVAAESDGEREISEGRRKQVKKNNRTRGFIAVSAKMEANV